MADTKHEESLEHKDGPSEHTGTEQDLKEYATSKKFLLGVVLGVLILLIILILFHHFGRRHHAPAVPATPAVPVAPTEKLTIAHTPFPEHLNNKEGAYDARFYPLGMRTEHLGMRTEHLGMRTEHLGSLRPVNALGMMKKEPNALGMMKQPNALGMIKEGFSGGVSERAQQETAVLLAAGRGF